LGNFGKAWGLFRRAWKDGQFAERAEKADALWAGQKEWGQERESLVKERDAARAGAKAAEQAGREAEAKACNLAEKLEKAEQALSALRENRRALSPEAVQTLALFQREGRLVDFLLEEIASYSDAQVGAAVRGVHQGCRKALEEYFHLVPILPDQEGDPVTVSAGYDPSSLHLTGQPGVAPPFRGILKHHGWRATKGVLPSQPEGQDRSIVAPAEVEVG
jgi:hypothetical protein